MHELSGRSFYVKLTAISTNLSLSTNTAMKTVGIIAMSFCTIGKAELLTSKLSGGKQRVEFLVEVSIPAHGSIAKSRVQVWRRLMQVSTEVNNCCLSVSLIVSDGSMSDGRSLWRIDLNDGTV